MVSDATLPEQVHLMRGTEERTGGGAKNMA
jgi:hypothetical protein